ncbi:L,D-transpeptidase [Kitasatospora sp. NPDC048365]|uniref:L,D-transpeptidase n=1 Tax=Kitasatospora sp. NPDC048365 TaxID=3364050 RepID=UPI003714C946
MPELEDDSRSEYEDRISSALRGLCAEAPAALPLPYDTVRRRGKGRRSRRRAAALAAVAVCAVGLLGSAAILPGRQQGSVAPPVTASTPVPSTGESAPPAREVAGYVDLAAHAVRVQAGGATLRTMPATAGRPAYPTPTGAMKVADKQASLHVSSSTGPTIQPSGGGEYDLTLDWCVRLLAEDGRSTYVCAMNWYGPAVLGRENRTFGAVGLGTEDARWFFDNVRVGDPVQVVNPESPVPGSTPG